MTGALVRRPEPGDQLSEPVDAPIDAPGVRAPGIAPPERVPEILAASAYVSAYEGSTGSVRLVVDVGHDRPRAVVVTVLGPCFAGEHQACRGGDDIRGRLLLCRCSCHPAAPVREAELAELAELGAVVVAELRARAAAGDDVAPSELAGTGAACVEALRAVAAALFSRPIDGEVDADPDMDMDMDMSGAVSRVTGRLAASVSGRVSASVAAPVSTLHRRRADTVSAARPLTPKSKRSGLP